MDNFDRIFGHRKYHNLSIDIGAQQDEAFLGKGWYGTERVEGAFNFRWSEGEESNIIVNLFDAFNYSLELRVEPLSYPQSPQQIITILVNGQEASRIQLKNGFNNYYVSIVKSYWKRGINEIEFRYQFCQQPKAVMESSDERQLAVAFDYITLRIIK